MPDIQLRFNKDMLVLSAPVDAMLARQGIDAARDREYLNLMEPDAVLDVLRLEVMAGAQCAVTTTEDITRARLAHLRMSGDASRLAQAALDIANDVKAQHVLAEIGPCGLPLDAASKASLNENRSQYADAARAFGEERFDAFFLNGFTSLADLKCALMGVAQVSGKPVFASVVVSESGFVEQAAAAPAREAGTSGRVELPFGAGYEELEVPATPLPMAGRRPCFTPAEWPAAIDAMTDLGAAVVGFETPDSIGMAVECARMAVQRTDAPLLAQLRVQAPDEPTAGKNLVPLQDIDEFTSDTMATAAVKLYGAGVQFLRATGVATPAYTGALAATVLGLDVRDRSEVG